MKEQIAKKWVKALRSGKYKQTKETLQDEKGFCCLGVLCDLAPPDLGHWDPEAADIPGERAFITKEGGADTSLLPRAVQKWAGLATDDGVYGTKLREDGKRSFDVTLVDANDEGATFEQIADFIEQHWEIL